MKTGGASKATNTTFNMGRNKLLRLCTIPTSSERRSTRAASCSELGKDQACRNFTRKKYLPWVKNVCRRFNPNITERRFNLRSKGNKGLVRLAATRVSDDRLTLFQHGSKLLPPDCPSEFSSALEKLLDKPPGKWSTYIVGLIFCRVFAQERKYIFVRRDPCIQFRNT